MAEPAKKIDRRLSFAEYVARELKSDVKSEYHAGEILEMSGGTIDHSRIIRNIAGELRTLLRGRPCEPFESNLRVYVADHDRGFYPDAQIICGPVEYQQDDTTRTTVLNPAVVFEVLSPGTANYDRGEKLRMYLDIPSLQQCVLIESLDAYVELYSRRDDGWLRTYVKGLEAVLRLESVDISLRLAEIYLNVELRPREG